MDLRKRYERTQHQRLYRPLIRADYFNDSLDSVFGVINKQVLVHKLQEHFGNGGEDDSIEWYALRNAVYASGCKIHLSKMNQPQSFEHAQYEAWKYFENALSVHTELIYMRSGLMAIQALITMVRHVSQSFTRTLTIGRLSSPKA